MSNKRRRTPKSPPSSLPTLRQRVQVHLHQVFWRHWIHWVVAVVLIFLGSIVSHRMEESPTLFDWRYRVYRYVQNPWAIQPAFRDVVVVTIDDDQYWRGELARRVPIKRQYLARLITELALGNPSVIALDFDLRAADPTGKTLAPSSDEQISIPEHPDYVEETVTLLTAINALPENVEIVLPRTINRDHAGYMTEADVYDGFRFSRPVQHGFISLSDDIRHIPRILQLSDGTELDSLSIASVRAFRPEVLTRKDWRQMMSASFVPRDVAHEISAGVVLEQTAASRKKVRETIKGRVVLVGAQWHRLGDHRGELIDSYSTPVGILPGVFIHANYVQAILDGRSFQLFRWNAGLEWGFGLLLSYVSVLPWALWRKRTLFAVVVALPFVASYLALQNWGVYCDVSIVYALLLLHLVAERLLQPWMERGSHP